MKKVLTVLLVMAVMFTFSFTTAFAAPTAPSGEALKQTVETEQAARDVLAAAQAAAIKQIEAACNAAYSRDETVISDAAWAKLVAAVSAEKQAAVVKAYTEALTVLQNGLAAYAADVAQNPNQQLLGFSYADGLGEDGYVSGYICFGQKYKAIAEAAEGVAALLQRYIAATDLTADETKTLNIAKFDAAKETAVAAITAFDAENYAKDDAVTFPAPPATGGQTKSSYEWVTYAKAYALARLAEQSFVDASSVTAVTNIYQVLYPGKIGETKTGSFFTGVYNTNVNVHPALSELRTVATATTDAAKVEYAKTRALALIKAAIETKRAAELEVQNTILFQQSVSSSPQQTAIDKANEEIVKINAKYDALLEVMTYRLEHVEYSVSSRTSGTDRTDDIKLYYSGDPYLKGTSDFMGILQSDNGTIAQFLNGALNPGTGIVKSDQTALTVEDLAIDAAKAEEIVKAIAQLKADAEVLKATVAVDGATAVAVDEELAEKTDAVYMTGNTSLKLDQYMSDSVVHLNAHGLLGTECKDNDAVASNPPEAELEGKIKINGVSYDRLNAWDTSTAAATDENTGGGTYSPANADAVGDIIDDAETAIKAAATVEEADQAFLSAKAAYDAVLTRDEQDHLFDYAGALYGRSVAAKTEIKAYIDYKLTLMGATIDQTSAKTALYTEYGIKDGITTQTQGIRGTFLEDVVDEASLNAAIADVKAFVDALKTKDQLKEEGDALVKAVAEVVRPVTMAQEEAILALIDQVDDYQDYCAKVGYALDPTAASAAQLAADKAQLATLYKPTVDAEKKALGEPEKVTLAQKDAVDTYLTDVAHYRKLSGTKDTTDNYTTGKYSDQIWHCQVTNVESMINVLPTYPTAEQTAAAKAALDALGFEGLCDVAPAYLVKLNKFTQDSGLNVKSLKIVKVHSTAGKGYIKIYWSTKGDTTGVEGYEVYRSTKMNSGYKKFFTAQSGATSYKNNKSLKKGTRYYYKVRAFATVNGEKITSDFSNKAYRKAK